jgi:hypothetical protein
MNHSALSLNPSAICGLGRGCSHQYLAAFAKNMDGVKIGKEENREEEIEYGYVSQYTFHDTR